MKLIKAKVYIEQDASGTRYSYPSVWLDNKERIPAILYPQDSSDQGADEKGTFQFVYPLVPDDLVFDFEKEGFEVADSQDAQAYSDKHAPAREFIQDQTKVISILAKVALDTPLTQKEKDALNPLSDEKGITMSKSFIEIARDYGADNV